VSVELEPSRPEFASASSADGAIGVLSPSIKFSGCGISPYTTATAVDGKRAIARRYVDDSFMMVDLLMLDKIAD
jgi:hypothetical protein